MKASDFVQLMKQERESSPAPAIPSAPAPVADIPSAADFVKRLSINRDHRIADSGTIWDSIKDKGASLVAGAPALGKATYDILRLATGDADWTVYGSRKYDEWQKAAVDALMSDAGKAKRRILERPINDPNAGVTDVLKTALSNPDAAVNMAVESMPTMFATAFGGGTTAAAAKTGAKLLGKELSKQALSKAATAGTIGTSAAMNAGDTFTSDAVQDLPMANRYQGAALSAALSAVAGKLLDGGAEGILARNMAGQGSKKGLVRGVVGGGAKEGGQEFVEEGGNAGGEQLAAREFRPNDILKRGALGGTVGTIMGGPIGGLEGMASRGRASDGATTKGAPTSSTLDALKVGGDTAEAPEQGERVVRPDAKIAESSDSVVGEAKRIGEAQVLPGSDRVVRVQNRDRSTPASIAQMTAIAAKPDYGRLSPSRDFGNGTPVVAYGSVDDTHKGRTDYAVTADGERIPVQYAVVEADDVLASNDASGNVVREYKTAGPDRMRVIAGNGRVAGMKRAYEQGTAATYREEMTADAENFGVDPAVIGQMKSPVLVRIMPEDKIRTDVGSISNTSTNMDMSTVEKANDDAANIDFGTLEFDEDGNPTDETIRQFVGKFPAGQAAGMMSGDGTISQQAKARFGAALFKKAYDNDQLTAIFAESTEGEAKNILKAMSAVAGKMVRLEGGGDFDLRPIVAEAAEIIVNARREGKTVSQYVSEGSLGQSAEAAIVAEALDANKRSVKEMSRILGQASDSAFEAMSGQGVLIGKPQSREDIINTIKEEGDAKRNAQAGGAVSVDERVEEQGGTSTPESAFQREAVEPAGQDEPAQIDASEQEVANDTTPEPDTETAEDADSADGVLKFSRRKTPATSTADEKPTEAAQGVAKKAPKEKPRYKTRTIENLTPEEQAVLDDYYDFVGKEEADRIRGNLERHWYFTDSSGNRKRTPWGHLALEAIFLRQAMRDLMSGREPRAASMLDETGMGPAIAAIKGGLKGIKDRLVKNGVLGAIEKCDFAVNSSFLNCNPSDACAAYCYAADGRGGIPLTMVKSELTDFVALNDPEWLADKVAAEFNSTQSIAARDKKKGAKTAIGNTQVALRLFEKGDGDEHWIPFIKALNKRGIRTHVFSKRPEFLRQVPEMNLRLLSVDSTNRELADQNPDLRLAFVYEGEQDLDILRKLYDRDQIGVVLPIKLKELMEGSNVKQLKSAIPGIAHHVCPIDGGSVKIGEFTCSCCDKFGCAGCMWSPDKSLTTERVLAKMDEHLNRVRKMDRMSLVEKLKMLHDEISAINQLIAATARGEYVTREQIRATGISLESIERYSEPVSGSDRKVQRLRVDGIAFLADEVGRRLQDESRVLERGRDGASDGLASGDARAASEGHQSTGPRPIRFWGKRPDRRSQGAVEQSASERSDEVKLSQSSDSDADEALASRGARKRVAHSAKLIAHRLEGDADVGGAFKRLRFLGSVVVVDTVNDLPKPILMSLHKAKASTGVITKRSDNGVIQGIYDTKNRVAFIIASNISPYAAKAVFLHEVGVHMATDIFGDMKSLAIRARNMVNIGAKQGDATALEVKRRMVEAGILSSTDEDVKPADAEEAFAYVVEVAAYADSRSPFRKWFDSVIARIKRWLNDHGIKLKIKPHEFVEMALANAQALAGLKGRKFDVKEAYKESLIGKSIERNLGGYWGRAIQVDKTGRRKFAWGEHALVGGTNVALDVLEAAIPAMRTTYSIRYARPEVRRMIREYAAECDAAVQEAGGVAQEMMKWSSADRELLSDTIEGMLKTGVLPPRHVVEAASKMSRLMTGQAKELVELGMLSEQAAARWRGRYLPRFYKEREPLLGEEWFKNLFKRGGTIRGVGGGSLKGRGCYKVVDSAAVPDFVRLGWEVRDARYNFNDRQHKLIDPKDGKGIESGIPVTIWRDWTPEERRQMGEIRDAGYRFTMGWMQTQRDIALGRLFKNIASNPELCSTIPMDGYSRVPDTEIAETGGVKRYGALAGMYVRDDVLASIMPHAEVSSAFMRGYKKLLAYWKEGKTALNPVSHMNNCVGNVIMAHLAGVDMWNAKAYIDTILDIANHEDWIEEAQEAGLYSGLFTREEIEEMLPEEFQKLLSSEKSATARGADWVFTYMLNYGLRGTMRKAYEFEDKLFRLVIYKSALDRGLSKEDAVDYTLSFIPTYDDLPGGARAIRDTAIPFFAWTYKTIPTILLCAARYPWRFAAIAAVLHMANALSFAVSAGDDDDDWLTRWQKGRKLAEAEEKLLPDYMRGWGAFANPKFLRLWTDETTGMPIYWNIANFVPGGQMFDATNQAGGMPWPEMLNPSSPAYSAYCALFLNVDTFMGRPLTLDSDTGWEKAEKRASYMWRQLAPAMAAGGYHYERIMNAMANATGDSIMGYTGVGRNGQAVTPLSAAFNTIGIKVRDVDFEQEAQHRMAQIMGEMKEVKANIRRVAKQLEKGSITQAAFDEYRDEQIGKITRSAEKLKEVREADETVRQNARQ